MSAKVAVPSAEVTDLLKKIDESFGQLISKSNSIFLIITISIFLISALLIVQVAFSVFNLKTKPLPPPPTKVIVHKKKKRGSSSKSSRRHHRSKKSSRSSKKVHQSQPNRTYPSKTATLQVEFDYREDKEKVEKTEPTFRAPSAQLPGYEPPKVAPRQTDTSGLESLDVTQKSSPLPKTATPPLKTATPQLKTATPSLKTATPPLKTATPPVAQNPRQDAPVSTYAMDVTPAPQQPVPTASASAVTAQSTNSWYMMHPIFGAGIKSEPLVCATPPQSSQKDVKKP